MSVGAAPQDAASGGELAGPVPRLDDRPGRCPACGDPLFGWAVVRPAGAAQSREHVLDRCEACGLGIMRELEGDAIAEPQPGTTFSVPNRRSWQAGIGGGHWGALEVPERGIYPTPASLDLLLEKQGLAANVGQPALGRNQLWMWLTLMNAFTFHGGFAREVLRRRLTPRNARSVAAFAADAVVSTLAALPLALVSVPLELLAVAFRRGGLLEVKVRGRRPTRLGEHGR